MEEAKVSQLRELIRGMGPLLVAFSGGVDSSLLLKLALDELGSEQVLAVTAHGDVHSGYGLETARRVAAELGARHEVVETHELDVPGYGANPPDRCYLCRSYLYRTLVGMARNRGVSAVVDGANSDDLGDYRPGMRAAAELGVRSPFAEMGVGKADIRRFARELGLSNWDQPASPCLASRFPYGEAITAEGVRAVEAAESALRELGFTTARVRHHGTIARIEVSIEEIRGAAEEGMRQTIVCRLRALGYRYVALDLEGFRSGSMNETLTAAGGPAAPHRAT